MVYGTVLRHSADLEIESAVGKGTIVRLSFAIPSTSIDAIAGRLTQLTTRDQHRIV